MTGLIFRVLFQKMSSDTEVFIKTKIDDDSQEIDIKDFVKVELNENSEWEGKVHNKNGIIPSWMNILD